MQAAYDVNNPNGTGRRPQGDRISTIFRLYRRLPPVTLESATDTGGGVLSSVRRGIATARSFIQEQILARVQTGPGNVRRVLVREVKCPLIIDSQEELPEVRSHFTYVSDGPPGANFYIDVPFKNARGITHFRISGRTFWTPILVDGVPVDGDSCLIDLQRLFEDYFSPPDGSLPADHELYWIDLNAPVSAEEPFGASEWLIHPPRHGVRVRQSAQRPFTRFFTLEFLGLRSNRDLARSEDGLLGSLFGLSTLKNLLDKLGLGEVATVAEQVFGVADQVKGLLDDVNAVAVAVTDVVTGVSQVIVLSVAKVRATLVGVQQLIGQLEDAYELAIDIPSLAEDQLRLLQQNFPGLVEDPNSAVVLTDSLERTRDFLLAVLADPSKFVPAVPGLTGKTIGLQIQPGTTLERLAGDNRVAPDVLIEANDLRYPFVDARVRTEQIASAAAQAHAAAAAPAADPVAALKSAAADADRALAWIRTHGVSIDPPTVDVFMEASAAARGAYERARGGGPSAVTPAELTALAAAAAASTEIALQLPSLPGVLYAGDVVRVPQDQPDQVPSVIGVAGEQLNFIAAVTGAALMEEERLFGIDLFLNAGGDLEWDEERVDLRLDRGLTHMANVQERYWRLPEGALNFAPELGNFAFADLGRMQTQADNDRLAYAIWRTLRQDPRIRRLPSVRAESTAGVATVHYDAELINGAQLADQRVQLVPGAA